MTSESHRLSILSDQEVEDLFGFPHLTDDERELYFQLSEPEKAAAGAIRTASVAAHLILELGYFKAKRQFFSFEAEDIEEDMRYVLASYFPEREIHDIKMPSRPTRALLQRTILELFKYSICGAQEKADIEAKAERIAMLSTQPVYIMREILHYMTTNRIVALSYSSLQDIVGRAVSGERTRITGLLNDALTPGSPKAGVTSQG